MLHLSFGLLPCPIHCTAVLLLLLRLMTVLIVVMVVVMVLASY
jgi:hypothetical protein